MDRLQATLLYDGECPFCSAYVRMLRLRDNVALELVDARTDMARTQTLADAGIYIDDGFVLELPDQRYHGDEALNALALMSTSSTLFNRVNAAVFSSPALAKALYPLLRSGRNLALRLLGKRRILPHANHG
ncbi:MAG: DCC1-like thiol-disulfide oxidoreductase family protein [Pseudomonadota bacterium]